MNTYELLLREYLDFVSKNQPHHYDGARFEYVACEVEMPEHVSTTLDITTPELKACYNNSFTAALYLRGDASYCLGYTLSNRVPIAIEHAWVKYDGKYYDPTFLWHDRMVDADDCAYCVLYEFSRSELLDFLNMQPEGEQCPPDLMNVIRLRAEKRAA